jgi:hypothetical protein
MQDPDLERAVGDDLEVRIALEFSRLADSCKFADDLANRGRFLTTECLIGSLVNPVHLTICAGRVVAAATEPALMRSWRFAYRATPQAWAEYWRPIPRPGWHDLLALTKRGAAKLEGDLHPFLSNLQFFKDLLALPRGHFGGAEQ